MIFTCLPDNVLLLWGEISCWLFGELNNSNFRLTAERNPGLYWFALRLSVIGLNKTRAACSTNQMQNEIQSQIGRGRFPALGCIRFVRFIATTCWSRSLSFISFLCAAIHRWLLFALFRRDWRISGKVRRRHSHITTYYWWSQTANGPWHTSQ